MSFQEKIIWPQNSEFSGVLIIIIIIIIIFKNQ